MKFDKFQFKVKFNFGTNYLFTSFGFTVELNSGQFIGRLMVTFLLVK